MITEFSVLTYNNVEDFNKNLATELVKFQSKGYQVELQFSTNILLDGSLLYNVLLIAKEADK